MVIEKIQCSKDDSLINKKDRSEKCLILESYATFKCKSGYKFLGEKGDILDVNL